MAGPNLPLVAEGARRRWQRIDPARRASRSAWEVTVLLNHRLAPADGPVWETVSRGQPCPCCGSASGCQVSAQVGFVHCRTTVSVWPMVGGGWLHASPGPGLDASGPPVTSTDPN